ncbi:MAG: hypothetical protein JSS86_21260 [Cyanobacteria bacterium SZAS LIN-2]|nr:hypothetical protein [Cyanobacteria bacterium SZAS LIN-2]
MVERKTLRRSSLLILLTLLSTAAGSTVLNPAHSQDAAVKPLQGLVQDTWAPEDSLPLQDWKNTVKPKLQIGLKWSDKLLPQQKTEELWTAIPDWLGGTWHHETATFIGAQGGRIGESSSYLNRHDDSFGQQRDNAANLFDLIRYPFVSVTQSGQTSSYFITYAVKVQNKNRYHITFENSNLEVVVSKADQKIQKIQSRNDALSWIKIGPNVTVDDNMTVDGDRAANGTIRSTPKQVKSFNPVDKLADGFDIRAAFLSFLARGKN